MSVCPGGTEGSGKLASRSRSCCTHCLRRSTRLGDRGGGAGGIKNWGSIYRREGNLKTGGHRRGHRKELGEQNGKLNTGGATRGKLLNTGGQQGGN